MFCQAKDLTKHSKYDIVLLMNDKKHIFLLKGKRVIKSLYCVAFILAMVGVFVFLPTKIYAEETGGLGDFFVVTQPPTRLDDFMSSFSGFVNNNDNEASFVWFEVGRNGMFEKSSNKQREIGKSDFANQIYHLEEGARYVYRAAARHEKTGEIKYGETKTFIIEDYSKAKTQRQTSTIDTHTNDQQTNNTNSTGSNNSTNSDNNNQNENNDKPIILETTTEQTDDPNNLTAKKPAIPTDNTTNTIKQNKTKENINANFNWGESLREQFFSTDKKGTILVNNNLKLKKGTQNNLALTSAVSGKTIFPNSVFGWVIVIVLLYLIISQLHNFSVAKKKKEEREKEQVNKINNIIKIRSENKNEAFA